MSGTHCDWRKKRNAKNRADFSRLFGWIPTLCGKNWLQLNHVSRWMDPRISDPGETRLNGPKEECRQSVLWTGCGSPNRGNPGFGRNHRLPGIPEIPWIPEMPGMRGKGQANELTHRLIPLPRVLRSNLSVADSSAGQPSGGSPLVRP